jgi:hypothetical protein
MIYKSVFLKYAENVVLFFDIEFFRYLFRVLHEASSSWLKFYRAFQGHPVDLEKKRKLILQMELKWRQQARKSGGRILQNVKI